MQNTTIPWQIPEMTPITTSHIKVKCISDLEGSGINFPVVETEEINTAKELSMSEPTLKIRPHNGRVEEALLLDIDKIAYEISKNKMKISALYNRMLDGHLDVYEYTSLKDNILKENDRLDDEKKELIKEYNELWGTN